MKDQYTVDEILVAVNELNSLKKNISKKIIYISTADVTNNILNKSLYVKNKIRIEKLIKRKFKNYIILRLPQIIGKSKNKNTLVNYFYYNIKNDKPLVLIKNFKRNVLDIDDILKLLKIIVYSKRTKNKVIILSNKYSVQPIDIVKIFAAGRIAETNFTDFPEFENTIIAFTSGL